MTNFTGVIGRTVERLRHLWRARRDSKEFDVLNANAASLNADSDATLADQAPLGNE